MTYRLHLSLAFGFLAACLLGSLALARAVGIHDPEPPPPAFCINDTDRNRVRTLTLEAIDEGLKIYVARLFDNWVKDEFKQPHRALVGFYNAAGAYERARVGVLNWNPPNCKQ